VVRAIDTTCVEDVTPKILAEFQKRGKEGVLCSAKQAAKAAEPL
jgi:hypothetical protein